MPNLRKRISAITLKTRKVKRQPHVLVISADPKGIVWHSQPLAKNVGSGTDSVLDLSVSQCTLRANQIQTS